MKISNPKAKERYGRNSGRATFNKNALEFVKYDEMIRVISRAFPCVISLRSLLCADPSFLLVFFCCAR
jgi:hypothetical protein